MLVSMSLRLPMLVHERPSVIPLIDMNKDKPNPVKCEADAHGTDKEKMKLKFGPKRVIRRI